MLHDSRFVRSVSVGSINSDSYPFSIPCVKNLEAVSKSDEVVRF